MYKTGKIKQKRGNPLLQRVSKHYNGKAIQKETDFS